MAKNEDQGNARWSASTERAGNAFSVNWRYFRAHFSLMNKTKSRDISVFALERRHPFFLSPRRRRALLLIHSTKEPADAIPAIATLPRFSSSLMIIARSSEEWPGLRRR